MHRVISAFAIAPAGSRGEGQVLQVKDAGKISEIMAG